MERERLKPVYTNAPKFTGRNVKITEIAKAVGKSDMFVNVNYIFKKKRNLMFRKNGIIFFRIFYESLEACDSQFAIL